MALAGAIGHHPRGVLRIGGFPSERDARKFIAQLPNDFRRRAASLFACGLEEFPATRVFLGPLHENRGPFRGVTFHFYRHHADDPEEYKNIFNAKMEGGRGPKLDNGAPGASTQIRQEMDGK
jgi:hypothetical protein